MNSGFLFVGGNPGIRGNFTADKESAKKDADLAQAG
jgi:hypothetical protein